MSVPSDTRDKREHFIPLSKRQLSGSVRQSLGGRTDSGRQWDRFFRRLEIVFHLEYHDRLERLRTAYAPFDPDLTATQAGLVDQTSEDGPELFFEAIRELLERANYRALSCDAIEEAMRIASEFGVRAQIELDAFKHLVVFVRGDSTTRRTIRSWRTRYRTQEIEIPVYERLVVAFQLDRTPCKNSGIRPEAIYVKLFQNVPHADVNMLLPVSRFQMHWIDRLKIAVPTLSGIGLTIFKVIKGGIVLAVTGIYGLIAFLGLVAGTVGYGVRSFFSYLQTKDKYQLTLTQSLYYQNLDNNAGAVSHLIDRAEEQDVCEAGIAYYVLWNEGQGRPMDTESIDRAAEDLLSELTRDDIDFEVDDGLDKLQRLGLATCDEAGRWQAVPMATACERLGRRVDDLLDQPSSDGIAD